MPDFDKYIHRKDQDSAKWDEEVCQNNLIPLSIADMDFKCAEPIRKALHEIVENGIYGYTYRGTSYYESILRWVKVRHNVDIHKENIIPSFGVVPSLHASIKALSKKGDSVLINTPSYDPFFSSIEDHGRVMLESPLRYNEKIKQYEINFEELEQHLKVAKIYLFCSPHNPTGRVWNYEELDQVAKLCSKYDVAIISDEIHNDLILTDKKHISFLTVARKYGLKTVICASPSKTFNLAGLNISYCITEDAQLKQAVEKEIYTTGFYHNNIMSLVALRTAYTQCDVWLDELLVYLKDNRDFVYDSLANYKDKVDVIQSEGTYLMLIKFQQYSSKHIAQILKDNLKLVVKDGEDYKCEEGYIRLNIACSREQLRIALSRIESFLLDM